MKGARVAMLIVGSLLALAGFGLLIGGAAATVGYATHRDGDGFFRTGTFRLATPTYAITSDHLDLNSGPGPSDWLIDRGALGTVRLEVTPAQAGTPVFAGIGPARDVAAYLNGVARDRIRDVDVDGHEVRYRRFEGTAEPAPPGDQPFWAVKVSASGPSELRWKVKSGDWTVVVMNADASPGVDLDARLGIKVGWFLPAAIGLAIGGLVLLGGGAALAIIGGRGLTRAEEREPLGLPQPLPPPTGLVAPPAAATPPAVGLTGAGTGAGAPAEPAYPVQVTARLDPELSRGLWLVKWLLAIPHVIVLFFLWIAFVVLTIVAFFAILFTGRYPRSLFDFNVGVMRWTWRVSAYAFHPLSTDQYPPFSLQRTNYPADFTVEYPERLSRGLVLVKWWLLAIPQYLLIGLFGTGWWFGPFGLDRSASHRGLGLVGLLVIFAGVSLLARGRYPTGIFNFVTGLDRWLWRVVAYAALMTDRYPPFRLDQGGDEPTTSSLASPPPAP